MVIVVIANTDGTVSISTVGKKAKPSRRGHVGPSFHIDAASGAFPNRNQHQLCSRRLHKVAGLGAWRAFSKQESHHKLNCDQ